MYKAMLLKETDASQLETVQASFNCSISDDVLIKQALNGMVLPSWAYIQSIQAWRNYV